MKTKYKLLLWISSILILLDQVTKTIVIKKFQLGESVEVIGGLFNFTYARNTGAAFSMLSTWDPQYRIPFFITIPLIALAAILYVFRKTADDDHLLATALSLVVGGAIGNLIDRVVYNYVIDFLDFYWGYGGPHFATFNVADAAISVGVGLLIIDIFRKEKQGNASHTV